MSVGESTFFAWDTSSRWALIAEKSHSVRSLTCLASAVFLSSGRHDSMKFFLKISCSMYLQRGGGGVRRAA